jgi:polyisoprenoid-binding protein YceI
MVIRILFYAAVLGLFAFGMVYADNTFKIDPAHTYIGFSVRHMVVSNVKGNFTKFSGTINYDSTDITKSKVNVKIDAASITTDNEIRDKHLRSAEFFEVEKYPEITFESTSIEKKGDGYVMHGFLTMRGVKKPIDIPFDMIGHVVDPRGNERIGFEGSASLNRQDYGVAYNAMIEGGGLVAGNTIKIDLEVEAVKAPAEKTVMKK